MKGYAKPLHEFISGQQIQFVIPVYQRNYNWRIDNCNQLFNDLIKLSRSDRHSHFFGSIVTSAAGSGFNRFVIDGQQRLTTISLLLLAGIKAVNDGTLEIKNEYRKEEAYDLFLNAKYCNSERKIKLVPIENDRIAYDKIFNGEDSFDKDSKVTRNYRHFYDLLTRKPQALSFDQLLDTIKRLENSVHGEYNDVATDMKKKDATIEHIMPQTLNGDWKAMLLRVVKMITEKYPDMVDSLYDKGSYFWTSKTANLGYCTQIGVDKYLWTTMGNKSKLACLRYLFEKCDIAESELVMLLEPLKE